MIKFSELLALVGKTDGMKVPTKAKLLSSKEPIVATFESSHASIIVFSSGFYIYERKEKLESEKLFPHTVWAIDRVRKLIYGDVEILQDEFMDMEWVHPVAEVGENRIQANKDTEKEQMESTYSEEDLTILYGTGHVKPMWGENDAGYDEDDRVEQALSVLTEQQRKIFTSIVLNPDQNYEEIARQLGISNTVQICKQFHAACKKLGIDPKAIRK